MEPVTSHRGQFEYGMKFNSINMLEYTRLSALKLDSLDRIIIHRNTNWGPLMIFIHNTVWLFP